MPSSATETPDPKDDLLRDDKRQFRAAMSRWMKWFSSKYWHPLATSKAITSKSPMLSWFGLWMVPREDLRKDLRSPPGSSSNTMKRGIFSKQTPMNRTMFLKDMRDHVDERSMMINRKREIRKTLWSINENESPKTRQTYSRCPTARNQHHHEFEGQTNIRDENNLILPVFELGHDQGFDQKIHLSLIIGRVFG